MTPFLKQFFNFIFSNNENAIFHINLRNVAAIQNLAFQRQRHFYHMVSVSPWPLFTSIFILCLFLSFIGYIHFFSFMGYWIFFSFLGLIWPIFFWFSDIISESRIQHTRIIQRCLLWSFGFFIASEVMFFLSFFWAFFHASLSPEIWISCTWPPLGLNVIYPWKIPLLNTAILITSGITLTWSHKTLAKGMLFESIVALLLTISLAILFLWIQAIEYFYANFAIYDSVYGSCFFMLTGFHGIHVFLGTFMLIISLLRMCFFHFSKNHHIGFVVSIWYWHFVDIVWIFLFLFVYWWGNTSFIDYQETLTMHHILPYKGQKILLSYLIDKDLFDKFLFLNESKYLQIFYDFLKKYNLFFPFYIFDNNFFFTNWLFKFYYIYTSLHI